ncbi:DUF1692-domain-containing protein [Meredithblackwellia eburnea MCA 4105]
MADPISPEQDSFFQQILSQPAPLAAFDAFKKTQPTYKERTTRGGVLTVVLALLLGLLIWTELREYLYGEPDYEFYVEKHIGKQLQLNFDATIATPCHYLTVDVRDAVGDRLHISDEFKKDGTSFEIGQAQRLQNLKHLTGTSASKVIHQSRQTSKKNRVFPKTAHLVPDGPACRVYGTMEVKKVTGNLHVTTLGHGYLSWEHTDHALMNLSHVIHEFSFGPFFPRISQPLDNSVETTGAHFHIFQYFLSVVSTTYVDARRRVLETSQYSVTDMSRETEHGKGVPGIFFKYDLEPMSVTVRERTTTLFQFLIRLAGIVGGIVVCSDFGFRTYGFVEEYFRERGPDGLKTPIPTSVASPPPPARQPTFATRQRAFSLGKE